MQHHFRKIAKIALVFVYLVIAAGAIVRMTGSGMGCPDWPKCFGYYIPPTEATQLQWQPEREFKKGQVIIVDQTLQVANADFKTASEYDPQNWAPYTKHDYALFNPWHTWIEFINRLFGALAGLATLVLAIFSFRFWRHNKKITLFSWLVVFGMGFQAWLGATVVYSVLAPAKITVHMVMALLIVALLIYLIHTTKNSQGLTYQKNLAKWLLMAFVATMVQIILGTQVRHFVDEQIDVVGETAKHLWLSDVDWEFYVHRSFSIAIVVLNLFLGRQIWKHKLGFSKINWVLILIGIEILTGVSMYYLDFPFATQPVHLIIASVLFGVQFYLVLEVFRAKKFVRA
ncbi:cytochrome c oxidase assembly protein subunit 15 [Pricia antarctica]|uniref:Cytochrome c oxidase assembly protein subunit 15 n=1 Tax=Pricia antarctica TaxID=641691 RepID=A0A1G6ZU19_9FLAO|nr:COX15/CtaA family protein [Pricia antarctica]SDE06158.1 cytochrome c oxidase assembly protein subunit 15 [Pricia antarctica]